MGSRGDRAARMRRAHDNERQRRASNISYAPGEPGPHQFGITLPTYPKPGGRVVVEFQLRPLVGIAS